MIIYRNGSPDVPDLKRADIVFLAGNHDHPENPPFEHVALLAAPAKPKVHEDWLEVLIYGLPESGATSKQPEANGLRPQKTRYWLNHPALQPVPPSNTAPLGHPASIWNLVMRAKTNDDEAEFLMGQAAFGTGAVSYGYAPHFNVEKRDGVKWTNCLGFVVDFLTQPRRVLGRNRPSLTQDQLLVPEFDAPYSVPYSPPQTRNTPGPGHLARSLDRPERTTPYGLGFTPEECEATALARFFLQAKASS